MKEHIAAVGPQLSCALYSNASESGTPAFAPIDTGPNCPKANRPQKTAAIHMAVRKNTSEPE